MNNKITVIFSYFIAMFLALWSVNYFLTTDGYFKWIVMVGAVFAIAPLVFARKLPYDAKFLVILFIGYAVAGKGFAYLSPVEPVYIGEITLIICLMAFLIRTITGTPYKLTRLHIGVFSLLLMGGLYLAIRDFEKYRLVAIRDSSMFYYSLFFIFGYAILVETKSVKFLQKMLYVALSLWALSFVIDFLISLVSDGGLRFQLAQVHPILSYFYRPHPDSTVPLTVTVLIVSTFQLFIRKQMKFLIPTLIGCVAIVTGKAAGAFAVCSVVLLLTLFAKRWEFFRLFLVFSIPLAMAVAMIFAFDIKLNSESFESIDAVETLSQGTSATGTTTEWRLTWWKIVWRDTMAQNPIFGMGLGADITTKFYEEYWKIKINEITGQLATRYPHNIIFTVIGRLGLVGLFIFCFYLMTIITFLRKFARRHLTGRNINIYDMAFFSLFVAGLANAFVQATYEAPYAALLHWVSLAYLGYRYYYPDSEGSEPS